MKTLLVEIMPCGTKAKTLNPLGKHVVCNDPCYCFNRWQCDKFKEWAKHENSRVMFDIDFTQRVIPAMVILEPIYKPGSIHEATEINTKQIRIL